MLGAIAGDIIGSVYEFVDMKEYHFKMLPSGSHFTDDTVMTLAVAYWLVHYDEVGHTKEKLIECMQMFGRKYPYAGYGGSSTHGCGARTHVLTTVGATARQCA